MSRFLELLAWGVAVYFAVNVLVSLVFAVLAARATRRYYGAVYPSMLTQNVRSGPLISIVVPAYNETSVIVDTVRSLLALDYPELEIVVVNDGSTDGTLELLRGEFGLRPSSRRQTATLDHRSIRDLYEPSASIPLLVVDKENGGRADALNAGIAFTRGPLIAVMDADEVLEPRALADAVRPFLSDPFRTVAAGASLGIANGCRVVAGRIVERGRPMRVLPLFQAVEYDRAFHVGRMALGAIGGVALVSGGFGVFRRDVLLGIGGYDRSTLSEDLELTLRLVRFCRDRKLPYRIVQIPAVLCWTSVPETARVLHRQRRRWHRGLRQALWLHRGMALRRRYGLVGLVSIPWAFTYELVGPLVTVAVTTLLVIGVATGSVGLSLFVLILIAAWVAGVSTTLMGLALTDAPAGSRRGWRDLGAVVAAAFAESVVYRPMTLAFRLESTARFRTRIEWGDMERQAPGSGASARRG